MKVRCLLVCTVATSLALKVHGATNPAEGLEAQGGEYRLTRVLRGDQVSPRAALSAGGGYLVWQDNATDGDGFGISAARLGSGLSADLETFRVNVEGSGDQERPDVALLEGGKALIVWQSGNSIRARLLDASGVFGSTADIVVNTHEGNRKVDPVVAPLDGGGALVIWGSYGQDDAASTEGFGGYRNLQGVFAQRLGADGQKVGAEFQLNQYTRFNQRNPAVARLASGKLIAVWVSERGTIGNQNGQLTDTVEGVEIKGRFLGASGEPEGDEFTVSDLGAIAAMPTVTASGDGFAVAWTQRDRESKDVGLEIFARYFKASGAAAGAAFTVNSYWKLDQSAPSITSAGGRELLVWTSLGQDGSREGVYGQYLSQGSKVGAEFRVNTTTASQQIHPRVIARGNDGYLAFWTGFTGAPGDFELSGQRYSMTLPQAPQPVASALSANRIALAWPPVGGYEGVQYLVYVDGNTQPEVTSDIYWSSPATFQPASTHTFRLGFKLPSGVASPLSSSVSSTTWGADENFDGLPDDWQAKYWGNSASQWPAPNEDSDGDGMKNRDEFLAGTDPKDSTKLLRSSVKHSAQGAVLTWNTTAGQVYQIEESTDLKAWTPLGSPRFARSTTDQAPVESTASVRYYRVIRLR